MNFGNNLLVAYPKSPDATVQLVQSGGVYPPLGTFTSRIFDRGNVVDPPPWERIIAQAANQFIDSNAPRIQISPSPNTIAIWPFENNLFDSTENAFNGKISGVGSISFSSDAVIGEYSTFFERGDESRIAIEGLHYTQNGEIENITVSFWHKWNSVAGLTGRYQRIISFDADNYFAVVNNRDTQSTGVVLVSNIGEKKSISVSVPTGDWKWHHFAFSYSYSMGLVSVYLDGEKQDEQQLFPPGTRIGTGNVVRYGFIGIESKASVFDGEFSDTNGWYSFHGKLDEMAIFSIALNDDDIKELYENGTKVPAVVYQMRSSDSAATIATKNFVGPDGTTSTYYHNQLSEGDLLSASATADWNASHQYAQYRATLYPSTDTLQTPGVQEVALVMSDDRRYVDTKLRHFSLGTFSNTETVEE